MDFFAGGFSCHALLVIGRGKSSPRTKVFIGYKNGHIRTDFGEDEESRELGDASNGGNTLDLSIKGSAPAEKFKFPFGDGVGNEIKTGIQYLLV